MADRCLADRSARIFAALASAFSKRERGIFIFVRALIQLLLTKGLISEDEWAEALQTASPR
jgi:hypothetical protein